MFKKLNQSLYHPHIAPFVLNNFIRDFINNVWLRVVCLQKYQSIIPSQCGLVTIMIQQIHMWRCKMFVQVGDHFGLVSQT